MSAISDTDFQISHPSMLHLLMERAGDSKPRMHIYNGGKKTASLSYQKIFELAQKRADALEKISSKNSRYVLLEGTNDDDFVINFFAIQLAGLVPVPVATNLWVADDRYCDIIASISQITQSGYLLGKSQAKDLLTGAAGIDLVVIDTRELADKADNAPLSEAPLRLPHASDIAYLQFSSGSTGAPKGVVISHFNVMANIIQIVEEMQVHPDNDVTTCWLPFHHDMGLLAGFLIPLYVGLDTHVMNPYDFSVNPGRWLKLISQVKASIISGPNSAFHMAAKKVKPATLDKLDLSSVRVAMCAAEPVNAKTLRDFANTFAPCGFRDEAFMPAYGLAENTLAVTLFDKNSKIITDRISKNAYTKHAKAEPCKGDDSLELVACGKPLRGVQIRIVDDNDKTLPERCIGNILIKSPSMASGYHARPDLNQDLFCDGMLRTGDLGYIADGEIYITGRKKDVIIINGLNINAEEIERHAFKMRELRAGRLVAFATTNADGVSERPHLLIEVKPKAQYLDPRERARLRTRIAKHLSRFVPIKDEHITLIPPGSTLKTTSGKVRRGEMKVQYERGKFNLNDLQFSLAFAEYKARELQMRSKLLIKKLIPIYGGF